MPEAVGSTTPGASATPPVENALLKEAISIIEGGFEKNPAKPSPNLVGALKELVTSERGAVLVPDRGPLAAIRGYISKVLGKTVPEEAAPSVVSSTLRSPSRHFFPPLPRIDHPLRTEATQGSLGPIDIQLRGQANLASRVPGLSKAGLAWHQVSMEKALPGKKGTTELNDAGDALVGRILKSPERVNVTVEDAKLGKLLEVRAKDVPWVARFKSNGEFVGFVEVKTNFAKTSTALKGMSGAAVLTLAAVTPSQPGQEDDRAQANQPTLLASAAPQAPSLAESSIVASMPSTVPTVSVTLPLKTLSSAGLNLLVDKIDDGIRIVGDSWDGFVVKAQENLIPQYGNWGGRGYSGGNEPYPLPPVDSMDEKFMYHDFGYAAGRIYEADKKLVENLKALPSNPNEWPSPPRIAAYGYAYRLGALWWFSKQVKKGEQYE